MMYDLEPNTHWMVGLLDYWIIGADADDQEARQL